MTRSRVIHLLLVLAVVAGTGCASRDWPAYRYQAARTANQPHATALSDPSRVPTLHQVWQFKPSDVGDSDSDGFVASPTVYRGRVFVGHRNGRFYAVDAGTGTLAWRFPAPPQPALLQNFSGNPSSPGIASSGMIAKVWVPWFWFFKRPVKVVIFGAPDPAVCVGAACGSGRLWALNVDTGALVWKSDVAANLTGLTHVLTPPSGFTELHERIGYSSPVVANDKVYVGIADNGDSPIQRGRLAAVDLQTGSLIGGFSFVSSGPPRGGGIWSSPAASGSSVFVTTGNGCRPINGGCASEPANNHALSLIKLDGSTGGMQWKLQPVPWALDDDPDWAGTPLATGTSCGQLTVATMKDGYTHAVNTTTGVVAWSFPFVTGGLPFTYGTHGDWGFTRPAASWRDVIFTVTGGFPITTSGPTRLDGYNRLYALNACAPYTSTDAGRVRWIADVPGLQYTGQPTVTRGIVYVGNNTGKLFAIADPDVAPPVGTRCSNPLAPYASIPVCLASGFEAVPSPKILATVQLTGGIRTEPVLARGRVYVATTAGRLYALEP
jgi:outer membrane protein assembly factor BamB